MKAYKYKFLIPFLLLICLLTIFVWGTTESSPASTYGFPRSFESYDDEGLETISQIIFHRIKAEPFNVAATLIFFLAIFHILMASWFKKISHHYEQEHNIKKHDGLVPKDSLSLEAGIYHFLGEPEAIFGLWTLALGITITLFFDWSTFVHYVGSLNYKEPMYTVVIMTIASSRPILKLVELLLWKIVKLFGGKLEVWWLTILILAPLSSSFITEPAAMTIGALLLAEKFYELRPNSRLKYASIALLFVNISIGGTLTNFSAHPILMVAHEWHWSSTFTFMTIGTKAILAIFLNTLIYYLLLKKDIQELKEDYELHRYKRFIQRQFISQRELERSFDNLEIKINSEVGFTDKFMEESNHLKENITKYAYKHMHSDEIEKYGIYDAIDEKFSDIKLEEMKRTIPGLLPEEIRPKYRDPNWDNRDDKVPLWVMLVHVVFIIWTVIHATEPILFIGGFMFFLGFFQVTAFYQNRINLKPALLVAFFISGIIIHGSLQGWWIAPVLGHLPEVALTVSSLVLSSFNDNASITYLGTLVEGLSDTYKYAIVTGALAGGGLTVIANSPNPVGQSILKKYFHHGISAWKLLHFALLPSLITAICFWVLRAI